MIEQVKLSKDFVTGVRAKFIFIKLIEKKYNVKEIMSIGQTYYFKSNDLSKNTLQTLETHYNLNTKKDVVVEYHYCLKIIIAPMDMVIQIVEKSISDKTLNDLFLLSAYNECMIQGIKK